MKKILSVIAAAAVVMTALPSTALTSFAADTAVSGTLTFADGTSAVGVTVAAYNITTGNRFSTSISSDTGNFTIMVPAPYRVEVDLDTLPKGYGVVAGENAVPGGGETSAEYTYTVDKLAKVSIASFNPDAPDTSKVTYIGEKTGKEINIARVSQLFEVVPPSVKINAESVYGGKLDKLVIRAAVALDTGGNSVVDTGGATFVTQYEYSMADKDLLFKLNVLRNIGYVGYDDYISMLADYYNAGLFDIGATEIGSVTPAASTGGMPQVSDVQTPLALSLKGIFYDYINLGLAKSRPALEKAKSITGVLDYYNGWNVYKGQYRFYVNDVPLKGFQMADGLLCNFDKVNGMYTGTYTGWSKSGADWYYVKDGRRASGNVVIDGVTRVFDTNGKLLY